MAKRPPIGRLLADAPDTGTVPDGGYLVKVLKVEETQTSTNKLMYKLSSEIIAPKEHRGQMLYENFVIGTDDDPDAEDADTWKNRGASNFRKLAEACGVELGDQDAEDLCNELKGQKFFAMVIEQTQTEGDYKGSTQNRIRGFYKEGEKEPFIEKGGKKAGAVKGKPVAKKDAEEDEPRTRKSAKAKDADEDDEPPRKKKPADDDDADEPPKRKRRDDDDDDADDEPKSKKRPKDDDDDDDRPAKKSSKDDDDDDDDRPRRGKAGRR